MSYNHTYAQIKDILKSSKKMTKEKMLEIAKLAIVETMGSEMPEGTEITWDSKLGDELHSFIRSESLSDSNAFSTFSFNNIV